MTTTANADMRAVSRLRGSQLYSTTNEPFRDSNAVLLAIGPPINQRLLLGMATSLIVVTTVTVPQSLIPLLK